MCIECNLYIGRLAALLSVLINTLIHVLISSSFYPYTFWAHWRPVKNTGEVFIRL